MPVTAPSPNSAEDWCRLGRRCRDGYARIINARAEIVHTKPAFGAAFRSRRCVVPANGWFEWQRTEHGKQPFFLALEDGSPLSFAALWEYRDKDGGGPRVLHHCHHGDLTGAGMPRG